MFDSFVPQHEDFLLALQMNEEQYQKVFLNLNKFIYSGCIHWAFQSKLFFYNLLLTCEFAVDLSHSQCNS